MLRKKHNKKRSNNIKISGAKKRKRDEKIGKNIKSKQL